MALFLRHRCSISRPFLVYRVLWELFYVFRPKESLKKAAEASELTKWKGDVREAELCFSFVGLLTHHVKF